jgi:hypothetical protein
MSSNLISDPGQSWVEIIIRPKLGDFAAAFTASPVLEASILPRAIVGSDPIRRIFMATRSMYDRIAFVGEARLGSMTMLEWQGSFNGHDIAGVTVLDRDTQGLIARIRLFHEPYDQVIAFAADLAARTAAGVTQ